MSEEKYEQSFKVASPSQLVVRNIRGKVDIQPGEDGTIQVTAIKHTDTGDAQRTEIQLSQDADDSVTAVARFPEGSIDWLFGSKPCKVDFVIRAPRQCSLKIHGVSSDVLAAGFQGEFSIKTVSGDLVLRDLDGQVTANSVSGSMELERLDGCLKLNTVSGDIRGRQVSGSIRLDTVSGDMRLGESSLPSVEAESVSGNLEMQTSLGEGPYRFHSVSGGVRLTLPPSSRCSAELHSISGHVSTNLPQTSSSRHGGTHRVEVQGGGVSVLLNSVSGNLALTA